MDGLRALICRAMMATTPRQTLMMGSKAMIDIHTLERRQAERYEHARALQALIDAKQLELDNLRASKVVTWAPFAVVR